MYENTNIYGDSVIMNPRAPFIMKKKSDAAIGLLVVTGNHMSIVGLDFKHVTDEVKDKVDKKRKTDQPVVVEEDVWLASRVTLLSGVTIGRGCIIGSGSVVRVSTPPYSIVAGNPAKVIGFRFTPEEIIEHEKKLYSESERISIELLEKNYNKYFLKRLNEIKEYTKI